MIQIPVEMSGLLLLCFSQNPTINFSVMINFLTSLVYHTLNGEEVLEEGHPLT